jgi:hypothetical protein
LRIGRGVADRSLFLQSSFAGHSGGRPITDKPGLGGLGARLDANTIAFASNNPNFRARQSATLAEADRYGLMITG